MIENEIGEARSPPCWRLILAVGWIAGVGGMVMYLLLRYSPNAGDLPLPTSMISWLNWAHDLRTLPMAWGYAAVPAWLLAGRRPERRGLLAVALLVLVGGEISQAWIPTRSFTLLDVGYSILGVGLAEWMVARWMGTAE